MKLAHVMLLDVCVTIGLRTLLSTRFPNSSETRTQLRGINLAVKRCGRLGMSLLVKMRKSRIEYKWSGLAWRADVTADMVSRQQWATTGPSPGRLPESPRDHLFACLDFDRRRPVA